VKRALPSPASIAARPAAPKSKIVKNKPGSSVADQQARAKGFALDLSMGGPDAEDIDFKESA
jgi:methyl-accepting chemotaxis protein